MSFPFTNLRLVQFQLYLMAMLGRILDERALRSFMLYAQGTLSHDVTTPVFASTRMTYDGCAYRFSGRICAVPDSHYRPSRQQPARHLHLLGSHRVGVRRPRRDLWGLRN